MSWKAAYILSAGLWAMTAVAEQPPVGSLVAPLPGAHAQPERAWLAFAKTGTPAKFPNLGREALVCAIPLKEMPVAQNSIPMPIFRPRKQVEPMPLVRPPAPPCEENKR